MEYSSKSSEDKVLSAILSTETLFEKALDRIDYNYFYDKYNRFIFKIIVAEYDKNGIVIDTKNILKLINKELKGERNLEYGIVIDTISKIKIDEKDFEYCLQELEDKYYIREIVDLMSYTNDVLEKQDGVKALKTLEAGVDKLSNKVISKNIIEKDFDSVEERLKYYEDVRKHPEKYKGILSGFSKLDYLTGGFQKSELILVIAATGHGKSAMLLNLAYNAWVNDSNIVYITIEMPAIQIMRRLDSRITAIEYHKLKMQNIEEDEIKKLEDTLRNDVLKKHNKIKIIDIPENCSVGIIKNKLKRLSKNFKIDLVVIDYLGLIRDQRYKSRYEEATNIAQGLKELARSLNVPIVTANQVTTESSKMKKTEHYETQDVRDSRMIPAYADLVFGLKIDFDTSIVSLSIPKYRDGTAGNKIIHLRADLNRMLLCDLEMQADDKYLLRSEVRV